MARSLLALERDITTCRRCPRLRSWCLQVAERKRPMYRDETYWGKPVPGFGDPAARLLVLGLAPGAHGANRTGRVFTGDRSGDWLYRALHSAGFANQPESSSRNDGLALRDCWVSASVRCAPPANKPLPTEVDACRPFLLSELRLLTNMHVIVALGRLAWDNLLDIYQLTPRSSYPFSHLAEIPRHPSPSSPPRPYSQLDHPLQPSPYPAHLSPPLPYPPQTHSHLPDPHSSSPPQPYSNLPNPHSSSPPQPYSHFPTPPHLSPPPQPFSHPPNPHPSSPPQLYSRPPWGQSRMSLRGHDVAVPTSIPTPPPTSVPTPHPTTPPSRPALLASYHPSQQNTQTGRLTREMLDAVFSRARAWLDAD